LHTAFAADCSHGGGEEMLQMIAWQPVVKRQRVSWSDRDVDADSDRVESEKE
jgi:hypothetical protein